MKANKILFPVGYYKFHKNQLFNFTLNRWYSIGYARYEDMLIAGKNIKNYEDWKPEMVRLAENALSESRMINASFYYRSAEFFTLPQDPDKEKLYDKFSELFYQTFEKDKIQRIEVPYEGSFLPAIKVSTAEEKKGTILLHGGMDSFLEEWYLMMKYLANEGYDVIGFEGPGQGAALIKGGLPLEIEWEKPTSAILDYFNLEDVTLVGLSVGGWLCMRATAFEPRIKRVIASGHAIHYIEIPPPAIAWMFNFFMKFETLFNKSSYWKAEKNPRMKWEINQQMFITKSKTPLEAANKMALALSRENMHAENIKQDVLFFSGEDDHFIPIKLHKRQIKALVNAKSVTHKIFTKSEHAQNHCQIGNIKLALDTMVEWLEEKTYYIRQRPIYNIKTGNK
ncbi:MAG: alpha/beta fold hydrolase [Bacteroidota bacterium]